MRWKLILCVALTGCATVPDVIVEVPKVQAQASIMSSCSKFATPVSDIRDDLLKNIAQNKVTLVKCSDLNEKKKEFINKYVN